MNASEASIQRYWYGFLYIRSDVSHVGDIVNCRFIGQNKEEEEVITHILSTTIDNTRAK